MTPGALEVSPKRERISSLDGLRGIAAFVVVIHHCLLTSPSLSRVNFGTRPSSVRGVSWWLSYTPLHLLWAGPEAVFLFFVLSGFVLLLPVDKPSFRWLPYFPRRLLRLYLPVCASLLLAWLTVVLVPPRVIPGASAWLNDHHLHVGPGRVLHDLALVRGVSLLNGPLWSLQWEVIFSMLLFVYVFAARLVPRADPLKWVLLLGAIAVGAKSSHFSGTVLPIFGLGVLLATRREFLRERVARIPDVAWIGLAVVACLAAVSTWIARGILNEQAARAPLVPVEVLGAAAIVFIFTHWSKARRLGNRQPVRWLGARSFSLYLVHEPIVVSTAILLGGRMNPLLVLALAVPISLVAAHLFYLAVERPSHRTAQSAGRLLARSRLVAGAPVKTA